MNIAWEMGKMRRTGFYPAMFFGGVLAGGFPIINMLVRSEIYTALSGDVLAILLSANWELMGMLNLCLVVVGACVLYYTEYSQRAILKMESLPYSMARMFLAKVFLLFLMSAVMIFVEMAALAFCAYQWFDVGDGFINELLLSGMYECIMLIPSILLMTWMASMSPNVWVTLGIGAILIFLLSLFQGKTSDFIWFPLQMAQTVLPGTRAADVRAIIGMAVLESGGFFAAELIYLSAARKFR